MGSASCGVQTTEAVECRKPEAGMGSPTRRKCWCTVVKKICSICVIVIVSLVGAAGVGFEIRYRLRDAKASRGGVLWNEPFDSAKWKGDTGGPGSERAVMVNDLRSRFLKPGMTRQQVEEMLGRQDGAGWAPDRMTYGVGAYFPEKQEYLRDDSLLIELDAEEKVKSSRVEKIKD